MLNTKCIYEFLWFSELTVISSLSGNDRQIFVCLYCEDGDCIVIYIVSEPHASRTNSNLSTTGASTEDMAVSASEAERKIILWY
jgi:hypothetical protein